MITPAETLELARRVVEADNWTERCDRLALDGAYISQGLIAAADRIEALERALAYYASPANWDQDPYAKPIEELQALYRSTAEKDRGERARTALNKGDEK